MRSSAPALAVATLLLTACGSDDEPAAKKAAKSSVTPFPTTDRADLAPGTYTTQQFKPSITLTLPDGEWIAAGADSADHVEIEPTVEDPVDSSALAFHHMTRVFDPASGGMTPGEAVAGPADFAQWLTDHSHLRTTKPKPVEALGLKGVAIDVRVKSSQPRRYEDGSKSLGRFYVLEQADGRELVVEQYVEPASALEAQQPAFDALLASATVARKP